MADSNVTSNDSANTLEIASVSIPSVADMRKIMRDLSESLYEAWKIEISDRMKHLEFEGYITRDHLQLPSTVWRLPNDEVRYALCKLEEDLARHGYDYEFRFDDVDDVNWVMFYSIQLPERDEEDDDDSSVDHSRDSSAVQDEDFA